MRPDADRTLPDVEWTHYGGDAGGAKYSSLDEVTRSNVAKLEVAWMMRVGDFPAEVYDAEGHRAGAFHEDGRTVAPRIGASCGTCHRRQLRFEVTPLMVAGALYVSTARNRVLALDPATGAVRWRFDPRVDITGRFAEDLTSRGVSTWVDSGPVSNDPCRRRIFLATVDARLHALDAETGIPCQRFGVNGNVRLDVGAALNDGNVDHDQYSVTSPPAIINDIVIVGSAVNSNVQRSPASGIVRAYDARTGDLRWSFDPIPRDEDHPAWSHWTPQAARSTGAANVWSVISADVERDLVFLPTGSASPDAYGGERPGRNDFANSVVALRASTGQVVWSFQAVHHDLWDYDIAAQPLLINFRLRDNEVPAVVVGTKAGMLFVLDRESGVPLLPVEERAVPRTDVAGEAAWPTQPFPTRTPLLHDTSFARESAFGINDADRAFCRERIERLRNEGTFTPPSENGTLVWPGYWGGINWDGMAWDPERQLLVTTIKRLATVVQLHRRSELDASSAGNRANMQYMPQQGLPYSATREPLLAPSGIPCTPPPWGSLVSVSLAEDSVAWKRPLGTVPWLADVPGSEQWGSIVFGGPLITAGGLVFVGAGQDDRFRAFDIDTGALLWETLLPAGGQAAPMTYRHNGRQYIVIAAGGRSGIGSPGDWIVAFALPERNSMLKVLRGG